MFQVQAKGYLVPGLVKQSRRKIINPHLIELHLERLTDFGSNVECLAENKVGATATNITIPGLVVYTYT